MACQPSRRLALARDDCQQFVPHSARKRRLRDDASQFFMRRTIIQPLFSGFSTGCSVATRPWFAYSGLAGREARQICDTTATTSNPPPTVAASNNPAAPTNRVHICKIDRFLQPSSRFLQCAPSRQGEMFRHVLGLLAVLETPNFMRRFKL